MAKKNPDIEVLKNLPEIKIWGEEFEKIDQIRHYKGKFVITAGGKFIAKLLPKNQYDTTKLWHNTMLKELAVKKPESPAMKKEIVGGGKIELEMIGDYVECRFYGKSSVYGNYDPTDIDMAKMERAIEATFHLGMMPVLIIPNFEGQPIF